MARDTDTTHKRRAYLSLKSDRELEELADIEVITPLDAQMAEMAASILKERKEK